MATWSCYPGAVELGGRLLKQDFVDLQDDPIEEIGIEIFGEGVSGGSGFVH